MDRWIDAVTVTLTSWDSNARGLSFLHNITLHIYNVMIGNIALTLYKNLHLSFFLPDPLSSIIGPGGYFDFFFKRRLGPSIYHSPPPPPKKNKKNIWNFKYPKKIFEILATKKKYPHSVPLP